MFRQHEKIFEVYIEAQPVPTEHDAPSVSESHAIKLSCSNVYQPQWAIGAMRRVRNVTEVIDLGESTDRQERELRVVKVLYDAAVADPEIMKVNIKNALAGARGSHL